MDRIDQWAEDGLEVLRKRLEAKGGMPRSAYVLVRADPQTGEALSVWGTAFIEDEIDAQDDTFFDGVGLIIERGWGIGVIVAWVDEVEDHGVVTYCYRNLSPGSTISRTWRSEFVRENGRIRAGRFAEEFDEPMELPC